MGGYVFFCMKREGGGGKGGDFLRCSVLKTVQRCYNESMTERLQDGALLQSRYVIHQALAQPALSTVYRAYDTVSESMVALKEMTHSGEGGGDAADLLKREYAILRKLAHPGIPKAFRYFESKPCSYLVEQFIEGTTLKDLICTVGLADHSCTMSIVFQLCAILHYLNGKGIIYRDLKPGNIIISRNRIARLVDFGAARVYRKGKKQDTVMLGTPGFASPEHYGYAQTDERSDVFSMGALLYYMITRLNPGDEPFVFRNPSACDPGIGEGLSGIILKATALKPRERYRNIREFRRELVDEVQASRCGQRVIFCPLCWAEMRTVKAGRIELDECTLCGGIWCDAKELDALAALDEDSYSESMEKNRSYLPDEVTGGSDPGRLLHCPVCADVMKTCFYSRKAPVLLDRCGRRCGTWLDGGEICTIRENNVRADRGIPGEGYGIAGLIKLLRGLKAKRE